MAKIIVITDRQPWFEDKPRDKGEILDLGDADLTQHWIDNDLALALPEAEPVAPAEAEPVAPAKAGKAKPANG